MCDEVTDSRERRGLTPRVAALMVRTAAPARTRASPVSATTPPACARQRTHARVLVDRARRARAAAGAGRARAAPAAPWRRRARAARGGSAASRSGRAPSSASSATTSSGRDRRRRVEDLVDHRVLRLARRGLDEAGLPEPGVDALGLAPGADRAHAVRRRLAGGQRALVAEPLAQRRQVRPQRLAEPAVAAARAVAADVGLEQHHARAALEQVPRRPHAGVAAADDHDVRGQVAGGGRHRLDAGRPRAATSRARRESHEEALGGVGQHGLGLRHQLVELAPAADQRRGEVQDGVAAVVGPRDQALLEQPAGEEPAQQPLALLGAEAGQLARRARAPGPRRSRRRARRRRSARGPSARSSRSRR